MNKMTTKEKLIKATLELSEIQHNIDAITSRDISARSGTNLALINYHFGSKENLLREVAEIKLGEVVKRTIEEFGNSESPLQKIERLLCATASLAFENINSFRVVSRNEIGDGCIHSLELFRPYFRAMMLGVGEEQLTLITLKLLVFYHTILLSPEAYSAVLKVDLFYEEERNQFLSEALREAIGRKD